MTRITIIGPTQATTHKAINKNRNKPDECTQNIEGMINEDNMTEKYLSNTDTSNYCTNDNKIISRLTNDALIKPIQTRT